MTTYKKVWHITHQAITDVNSVHSTNPAGVDVYRKTIYDLHLSSILDQRRAHLPSFSSRFINLDIDPVFQACHLSAQKETYAVVRREWRWSFYPYEFKPCTWKSTTKLKRYTYGRALQQIASVDLPSEMFLGR